MTNALRNHSESATSARAEPFRWTGRPMTWLCALGWLIPCLWISTKMYRDFRGTAKDMTWLESVAFHGPSWLLLIPATPLLFEWVRMRPISRDHPWRIAQHAAGASVFGVVFLLIAVPVRMLVHQNPLQWSAFDAMLSKSIPQYVTMGTIAYGLIVMLGSLAETRMRLRAVLDVVSSAEEETGNAEQKASADVRITMTTPGGLVYVSPNDIRWISVTRLGARLHTSADEIDVRHSMTELEDALAPFGFARIHRSTLVNTQCIHRITGAPTRDSTIELDDGQTLAVSRRRRPGLEGVVEAGTKGNEEAHLR